MQVKWKTLLARMTVWLALEILFNFIGVDDLADYSEFIFETDEVTVEASQSFCAGRKRGAEEAKSSQCVILTKQEISFLLQFL